MFLPFALFGLVVCDASLLPAVHCMHCAFLLKYVNMSHSVGCQEVLGVQRRGAVDQGEQMFCL